MKVNELFEATTEKLFVVVKVGFDYSVNDRDKQGSAFAVFKCKDAAEAAEFASKADKLDWNDNDDHINHMAQNLYGADSAFHGYTISAKISAKDPNGSKYFGTFSPGEVKFE